MVSSKELNFQYLGSESREKSTRVSILIPTKNAGAEFNQVLAALAKQKANFAFELLIVDSGSTDETLNLAGQYGAHIIQIPPHEFNHGLTRNYGIQNCRGEIVVLMTQDALPSGEYWLQTLVDSFTEDKIAGVYAKQIPRPEADVLTKRNLERWLTGRNEYSAQEIKNSEDYDGLTPWEKYRLCVFDNVCSAVRKKVWEQIPFLGNDFGEDIEWAQRALKAGWQIVYQPKAAVIHSHNRSLVYEYKRTYMCHRKLYQLFGLHTIPSLFYLGGSIIVRSFSDLKYVLTNEPDIKKKLKLCLKIPFLALVGSLGQYRGAKDEKNAAGVKMKGI